MPSFLFFGSKEEAVYRSGGSNLWVLWKFIVPAAALLSAAIVVGQKAQSTGVPKYDLHTETKIKGTVDDVKLPAKGSGKSEVHLLVKTATDTIDVDLCPKSFLDDMGVTFTKGDEIVVTGSKVKEGDVDVVLAREVVKGTDTLVFRDDKGKAVWG
jgi:hypothetical protein